jgi:hypothetical protein
VTLSSKEPHPSCCLLGIGVEAIKISEDVFQGRRLAIGAPGVDGMLYVLQPSSAKVFAYYPIDEEFAPIATSVYALLEKWVAGDRTL